MAVAIGGAIAALLLWMQLWWWVGLPVLVLLGGAELWLQLRADRPVSVTLADDLVMRDAQRLLTVRVDRAQIRSAALLWRPREEGIEAVVVLGGHEGVLLALPFLVPADTDLPGVPVRWIDTRLGGVSGLIGAMAPLDRRCRQLLREPEGLRQLLAWLPSHAWTRQGLQAWRGAAPPLDMFGFYAEPSDCWISIDDDHNVTWAGSEAPVGRPVVLGLATRSVSLLVPRSDELPEEVEGSLPLVVFELAHDLQVCIPAPLPALGDLPPTAVRPTALHLSLPSGGLLLHALQQRGQLRLPEPASTAPPETTDADPDPSVKVRQRQRDDQAPL